MINNLTLMWYIISTIILGQARLPSNGNYVFPAALILYII